MEPQARRELPHFEGRAAADLEQLFEPGLEFREGRARRDGASGLRSSVGTATPSRARHRGNRARKGWVANVARVIW